MPRLALHDPDELDPLRRRYVKILLHAATTGAPPEPSPMDAGLVLCDVLAGTQQRPREDNEADAIVRDLSSSPAFYGGLLLSALTIAAALPMVNDRSAARLRRMEEELRSAQARERECELDRHGRLPLRHAQIWINANAVFPPARLGAELCADLWESLAGTVTARSAGHGRPVPVPLPMQGLLDGSWAMGTGQLLMMDAREEGSPDAWWMYELVALHALTTYAATSGTRGVELAVRRAALFHHRETQPDHATTQPWAVHAFLLDPETVPTADLMLLAAGVNRPEGLDAVSRILLADAAVCLMMKKR